MEHRHGIRVRRNERIRIGAAPNADNLGHLWDISGSGALVLTSARLPVLSPVVVLFELAHENRIERFQLRAHVTRQCDKGLGVEWEEFSIEVVDKLLRHRPPSAPPSDSHDNQRSSVVTYIR